MLWIQSLSRFYAAIVTGVSLYAIGVAGIAIQWPHRCTNPTVYSMSLNSAGELAIIAQLLCALCGVVLFVSCFALGREPPTPLANAMLVAIAGTVCGALLIPI